MRVAIVTEGYFPEISGVTVSLYKRLEYFSKWGHNVRVYAPDYSHLAHRYPNYRDYLGEVMPGITIVPFPSQKFYTDYTMDPKAYSTRQVEHDMDDFGAEVIHVECAERIFMGFLGRIGMSLRRRKSIPITAIFQTNYVEYLRDYKKDILLARIPGIVTMMSKLTAWVYNSYDVTMTTTPVMQKKLIGWGVNNTLLDSFIGVDSQAFYPAVTNDKDGQVTLTYIGRFTADKQIDILLEALGIVAEKYPNCRFVLVGDGMELARIKKWAENYPGTQLPGRVPYEQLPPYYQNTDILVTASIREVRPLTIQEALACGVPVVAPASGGIVDQIENGITGLLVEPNSPNALAEAVLKLINDPALRQQMGQNGNKQSTSIRSWEYAAGAMLRIWQELKAGNLPQ